MGGFFNMLYGFNPACIVIMPMLGRKEDEYPRFRDCYISDDEERICIYTRVGGGNRNCGFGEEELYEDPNFVTTYDDEWDNTYATYEFNVPDKWKDDFEKIKKDNFKEVSDEYVEYVKAFYPTLTEKGIIDSIFRVDKEQKND